MYGAKSGSLAKLILALFTHSLYLASYAFLIISLSKTCMEMEEGDFIEDICADIEAKNSNRSARVFGTGNMRITFAFSFAFLLTPYNGMEIDTLSR